MRLLYSTWPDADSASACAKALVEQRLAACVTVLPGGRSTYRWEGEVRTDPEVVLLAKTSDAKAETALAAILRSHPYDLPCVLSLPANHPGANPAFLDWVEAETR